MTVLLAAISGHANAQMADPTRPPPEVLGSAGKADADPSPRVHSIMIGASKKYALIDGVTVKEGDRFRGMKVKRINQQSVLLSSDSGPVTLYLSPAVSKTAPRPNTTTRRTP